MRDNEKYTHIIENILFYISNICSEAKAMYRYSICAVSVTYCIHQEALQNPVCQNYQTQEPFLSSYRHPHRQLVSICYAIATLVLQIVLLPCFSSTHSVLYNLCQSSSLVHGVAKSGT